MLIILLLISLLVRVGLFFHPFKPLYMRTITRPLKSTLVLISISTTLTPSLRRGYVGVYRENNYPAPKGAEFFLTLIQLQSLIYERKKHKTMKKFFSWLEGQDKLRNFAEGIMSSPKLIILVAAFLALLATIFQ